MASKKGSVFNVVVCGLTTSSFQGLSGQGAGKSYLCNRFMRPKYDDLKEHTSVLNNSDFGSNIINNDHFLYWGGKTVGLEDGQDVTFQLVEQTEFVDDATFKPFTHSKPYHKRCTQLKIQSGGKVMYINNDQLALPEEYRGVSKFPDRFNVDGFIVCVDVSCPFDQSHPQRDFFIRLFQSVQQTKKPVVVVMTKYDSANDSSVATLNEIVSKAKKQVPLIEVSALKNINVDACFLFLCHLIDPKKPKTKLTPYSDAKTHLDERIRRIEESFQTLLLREVTDFSQNVFQASTDIQSQVEYNILLELKGIERVYQLIRRQLAFLKRQQIETRLMRFVELLPLILDTLLPALSFNDNTKSCCVAIRTHTKFSQYFFDVEDWRESVEVLKSGNIDKVPYGLLQEELGVEVLQNHINKVLRVQREEAAFKKIEDALSNASHIIPGTEQGQLWEELMVTEEAGLVGGETLTKLYMEHMSDVLRDCVVELNELLLERIVLFEGKQEDSQATIDRIDLELRDCPRYKRLDRVPDVRKVHILKYIGSVQVGDSASQARTHISEGLEKLSKEQLLRRETLQPSTGTQHTPGQLQWNLYTNHEDYFNLSLMGRTLDNVITLRSDFMNHLTGSSLFEVGGRSYRLDMSLFHGEDGPIETMTNSSFIPEGVVAVVTSMECLEWLKDVLTRLWLPKDPTATSGQPPYRGIPLVILALDRPSGDDADCDTLLHQMAKALAARVQAACLTERPTDQPKRLVVSGVVMNLLQALMDIALPTAQFFTSNLPNRDHQGLNIAVCTVVDDPYPVMDLLSPLLRYQTVCWEQGKLFLQSNLENMPRTCILTFHSGLNIKEILSFTRLGFILAYSTSRPASLSVTKFLLSKLPAVPKMLVAVVLGQSCDDHMIEEGRQIAQSYDALFVCTSDLDWANGPISEFLSKCWFVRFSSWSCQTMPEEVVSKQREKRQARALPSRPELPVPVPDPRARHSIGALLEEGNISPTPYPSATIPRQLHFKKPASLPSPPVIQDMGIYSDPLSSDVGIKQMKAATLERKKSSTTSHENTHLHILSPDIPDSPFFPEGDYASVEDARRLADDSFAMFNTLERQRRGLRSPSMSPPPVPFSPTDTEISVLNGGSEDDDDDDESNEMYATVETAHKRTKKSSDGHKYDHLAPSPEVIRKKPVYDHLNPPPVPERTDSLPSLPPKPGSHQSHTPILNPSSTNSIPLHSLQTSSLENMYATVDISAKSRRVPLTHSARPLPTQAASLEDMYTTIDLAVKARGRALPPQHSRHKSEDTLLDMGATYSMVKKPRPATKPKPPTRRAVSPEVLYSVPGVVRGRQSPPTPSRTPPPTAPKPTKRSTTPTKPGRSPRICVKAESFDAGMKTKPPLLPDLRSSRSFSMDKRPTIKSPIIPPRNHSNFDLGNRTSSLPKNYRHGLTPNGHALTPPPHSDESNDAPSLPDRHYTAAEMELDEEPPPLPPRVYNWSDFEDNDDELFQSEDELDDTFWSVSDQQRLYANITLATQHSDSVGGVEAIYQVVNRMVLVDEDGTNVQVARQPSMTKEEESAYDTLENVLKSMREVRHTPYSSTPSEGGQRGMITTPERVKVTTPTLKRPLEASSEQPIGLKSTPLTAAEIKRLQKTQKLLKRLEKQAQKEAVRRQAQEAKKKKREEEEQRRKEGKKKPKKGKKQPERTRYFGSPLEKIVDESGVPVFVRKCVEFVESEGMRAEGIYRVPGKKENVLLLQDKFEEDHNLDIASLDMLESAVSSTLKAYFKVLPDPLISESVAAQLLVVNSLDADSQKTRIHELLLSLPRPNLKTLKYMVEHLHRVQKEQEVNKMTPSNLSIVFWPTLMRPPLMDLADPSKQLGWQLIMTRMIDMPDFVPHVD